jgi:hypothetical protein
MRKAQTPARAGCEANESTKIKITQSIGQRARELVKRAPAVEVVRKHNMYVVIVTQPGNVLGQPHVDDAMENGSFVTYLHETHLLERKRKNLVKWW